MTPPQSLFGVIPLRVGPPRRVGRVAAPIETEPGEGAVSESAVPRVQLIAWTHFEPPREIDWSTDADGGQALAEFAGRACYQSWSKPNPATATNAGYLRHIIEVGHLAVLEHGTASFYITGISNSLAHELTRHRHLSFSQLSQRQRLDDTGQFVEPDLIAADPRLHSLFIEATRNCVRAYEELLIGLQDRLANAGEASLSRKQARQAARSVLPNATETCLVVSGNYRAWRHFIGMRAAEHADAEIRRLAVACLRELHRIAANVFADFEITRLPDGTELASSPLVAES